METLQRTANRGSISTGYDIDNSVKLEPDNTEYLSRTIGSTSNRKTFTVSCWFKRTELKAGAADANGHNLFFSGVDSTNMVSMQFHTWQDTNADKLEFRVVGSTNNVTTRRFRDTNAWYHIVLAVDTTQSTEADRWKLYVNGVQETAFDATSYPSQNADTVNNVQNNVMRIGTKPYAGNEFGYFAGYIADYYHIDGQALAPTDFGEFDEDSGIWKPKAYTGSFGTNGWYLDFVDGSDLGDDESGNGNDFTENNITAADQATDTPTNNFCTWSPLFIYAYNLTISEGGQKVFANASNWQGAKGSVGLQNGRWYWEVKIPDANNAGFTGIQTVGESNIGSGNAQSNNSTYTRKGDGNDLFYYGGSESTSNHGGGNMSNDNIIGVFLDLESSTKTLRWFKNGSSYGSTIDLAAQSTSFTTREVFPFYANITSGNGAYFNFGGYSSFTISSAVADSNGYGAFEYTPNDGTYDYYSICTKNISEFG